MHRIGTKGDLDTKTKPYTQGIGNDQQEMLKLRRKRIEMFILFNTFSKKYNGGVCVIHINIHVYYKTNTI